MPVPKSWFERLCDSLERLTLYLVSILLVAMLVVAWAHVFRRYVMNNAITWSEEFLRYSLVWFSLLSASIIFKQRGHLGLVLLVERLSPATRQRIESFLRYVFVLLTGTITYHGTLMAWQARSQVTPALRVPIWVPYAAIPVSFLLMTIYSVSHVVEAWPRHRTHDAPLQLQEQARRDT